MKKIIHTVTTLILAVCFSATYAQSINKKEAKQMLEQAWSYIKVNDSISYAKLWSLNDAESKNHRRPHTAKDIYGNFNAVREWLDTAVTRNLKISEVEIEPMNLQGTDSKFWIQAWFPYEKNYSKAFGFYIAYFNNKWLVRDVASTSTFRQTKNK